ncbi:hypothetical protein D3C78_1291400 [compost metagenome]
MQIVAHEADIKLAALQALLQEIREAGGDAHAQIGILLLQRDDERARKRGRQAGQHADGHRAKQIRFCGADVGPGFIEPLKGNPHLIDKPAAWHGQHHPEPVALEKRRAQFVFQLFQLSGQGGLHNMQQFRRLGEAAGFRDRQNRS